MDQLYFISAIVGSTYSILAAGAWSIETAQTARINLLLNQN
jgi:hypothetical protein